MTQSSLHQHATSFVRVQTWRMNEMLVKERKALPRLTNKVALRSMIASVRGARNEDMSDPSRCKQKIDGVCARKYRRMGEGYVIMHGPQPQAIVP
jgi:hypothetical protein